MQLQAVIQRHIPVRSPRGPQRAGAYNTPKSQERHERLRAFISLAKHRISKEWGDRSEDGAALEHAAEKEEDEGKGNARGWGKDPAGHTRTAEGEDDQGPDDVPGFTLHTTPYTYRVATPLEEVQGHIKPFEDRSKTVSPLSRDAQGMIENARTRASVQREEGGQDDGDVGLMSSDRRAEREKDISSHHIHRERERERERERADTFSEGLKLERSVQPLQLIPRSPVSPKGKRDSFVRFYLFNLCCESVFRITFVICSFNQCYFWSFLHFVN
jgi:hypothetical protein